MPRVDFHAHSSLSDGLLSPEEVAARMSALNVEYAALTDHDTAAGSGRFRLELARRGIACVEGLELTTRSAYGEVHILAYALGVDHPGLAALAARPRKRAAAPDTLETLRLARRLGVSTFLAHPFTITRDSTRLEAIVDALAQAGLDGLEALYGQYGDEERAALVAIAARKGLAVSAGSDFHEPGIGGQDDGVDMSEEQWRAFRALLTREAPGPRAAPASAAAAGERPAMHGRFALRIVLPALAALSLFLAVLFLFIPPRIQTMLLDRKKEMIRELTISASSILAEYAEDARLRRSSLAEAKRGAAARIRDIRYGREGKDYFWITDMLPRMVMHPYRPELEGGDLGDYRDENGLRVFVEFVNAVREKDEGYVEYLWQWKDDKSHIVPKLSYVRRFAPWDWVIGTGIYLDDVNSEIAALTGRLVALSLGVAAVLALLLALLVQQSLSIERGRAAAELAVRESRERYRALVEASTEGMVIVIDGACTFANASFLEMTGFSEAELTLHSFSEIVEFYHDGEAQEALTKPQDRQLECRLKGKSGVAADIVLTSTRFMSGDREGLVFTVKESGMPSGEKVAGESRDRLPGAEAATAAAGVFRARWSRRADLLEADPAARRILGIGEDAEPGRTGLLSLFPDRGERLYRVLSAEGIALRLPYRLESGGHPPLEIQVSAFVARDAAGTPIRIDGIVEDVTQGQKEERARAELLAALMTDTIYLQAPIGSLASPPLSCRTGDSIREVAGRMARASRGEILVEDSEGSPLGILTSRDLAERAVAAGLDTAGPVGGIMTAPLRALPAQASISDALRRMRERGSGRLILRDASGAPAGLLGRRDLLDALADSPGSILDSIAAASSAEELGRLWAELKEGIRTLRAAGLRAGRIAEILTEAHDGAIGRLVAFARSGMGEEPCPFAFLALGSAGRREMLPGSDQDNALVFLPGEGEEGTALPYFLELGERVCRALDTIGVPLCKGGTSALSERCCASLADWESRFALRIREPEPAQLLDIHVFFDFRAVCGEAGLAESLRRSVSRLLKDEPPFFLHLANGVRNFRLPPLPLRRSADAKEGASLLSGITRAYALKYGIDATNGFDRLSALAAKGILAGETARETAEALEFFLHARLTLEDDRGEARTGGLGRGGEALARVSVAQAALLQKRLGYDFLGT
jgi:PAS domain S-box-containing protein